VEKQLQIVIIEDDPADAERLLHELERQGFYFQGRRIQTQDEFLSCLEAQPPDLILSDHGLPTFGGFAALELVQEKCPHVPFIFVTGSYDQGLMVEMFDGGAAGYLHKNKLADLGSVIRQAQEEIQQRRQSRVGEEPVESSAETCPGPSREAKSREEPRLICSHCKRVFNERREWESLDAYLRRHQRASVTLALCPACAGKDRVPLKP
jgi:DNA-binding NtrC family response regulator